MKIDKLVLCEPANTVVSLTRGGLGFWSMETGALDCRIADTQGGKYKLDHLCLHLNHKILGKSWVFSCPIFILTKTKVQQCRNTFVQRDI